ncbi:MAG TPA: hypothetical protein PKY59_15785, partial [Pyrinomonadaceae bacterium]|nr:hypothetical protein [Pyrinomonadaceae bacterium]
MKKYLPLMFLSAVFLGCKMGVNVNTNTTVNTNIQTPTPVSVNANAAKTPTAPLLPEKITQPIEVNFEPNAFPPPGWTWIDLDKESPTVYDTKNGVLSLKLSNGKDFFGSNYTSPHLMKAITGDFEIETKVKFDPKMGYQGAGILIYTNDQNYL